MRIKLPKTPIAEPVLVKFTVGKVPINVRYALACRLLAQEGSFELHDKLKHIGH